MADSDFPRRFPIFPLPNVVLFPGTLLPLNIFEDRYRAMTEDALDGDRVIGMVLLQSDESAPGGAPAHVFDVGCAGRIGEHRQLDDGRFNLILHGARRFRIGQQELTDRGYLVASVELLDDPNFEDLDDAERIAIESARAELEQRVLELAQLTAPRSVRHLRRQIRGLDPVGLAHALSFGLNCGMVEKQSLLEASDPVARTRLLARLIEFKMAEARLGEAPQGVN